MLLIVGGTINIPKEFRSFTREFSRCNALDIYYEKISAHQYARFTVPTSRWDIHLFANRLFL
jgi:hypothetical protein